MEYPRLLVLSNNSFSKSNSNGRTLGNLLNGWPKDKIAQFCLSSDGADFEVCENYYCVTDGDVLKSTVKLSPAKRRYLREIKAVNSNYIDGKKKFRKTAVKMLLRNFAWNLGIWQGNEFSSWIKDFCPDIILVQSGDSFFIHDLAVKIARKTNALIAVFNTEAPFLFKKDYFRPDASLIEKIVFPIYRSIYNRSFLKFMRNCSIAFYGNELLQHDYQQAILNHCKSCVIYNASGLNNEARDFNVENPRFSYLGNMGYYRPKALAIVGKVLQNISPNYFLDVYGNPQTTENEQLLNKAPGIRFHGNVDYDCVKKVIHESDVLFHVEYPSEQYAEALKYGFSTKIADSIASKRIFIMFAPSYIAGSKYIKDTNAGIYCENPEELEDAIIKILKDCDYRAKVLASCQEISKRNHEISQNRLKMIEALCSLI